MEWGRILASGLIFACAACSSGGGGGGGSAADAVTAKAQGAITVIGSAAVTGTVWDTDGAEVFFGDVEGVPADLAPGMVALVQGERPDAPAEGTAFRVDVETSAEGPIASRVDLSEDLLELEIVGRTVRAERGATFFGGLPADFDFDTLAVDDLVAVWGFVDGDEGVTATRIEKRGVLGGASPTVRLEGRATSWMPAGDGGSFEIGDVLVLYEDADLGGGSDGGATLADEPFVTVDGVLDTAADEVDADRVVIRTGFEGDFEDLQIEGILSGFIDVRTPFEVGGQRVEPIFFVDLVPDDLENILVDGVRVEVEGRLLDGVLSASVLRLREAEARVVGEIAEPEDVNVDAGTIVLLGVTIQVDGTALLEDLAKDPVDPLTLADLMAGDSLDVRGTDLEGIVQATTVRRTEPGDVLLRGRVQGFVAPPDHQRFTTLGVPMRTDATTSYSDFPVDVTTEDDFYAFLFANLYALLETTDLEGDPTLIDLAASVAYRE
jgi:hypothetical protein